MCVNQSINGFIYLYFYRIKWIALMTRLSVGRHVSVEIYSASPIALPYRGELHIFIPTILHRIYSKHIKDFFVYQSLPRGFWFCFPGLSKFCHYIWIFYPRFLHQLCLASSLYNTFGLCYGTIQIIWTRLDKDVNKYPRQEISKTFKDKIYYNSVR